MTDKLIALELAAFLDSSESASTPLSRKDVRELAEIFISICFESIGTKPRLMSGEDLRSALTELLPSRIAPKDTRARHVPALLAAFIDHLEATQVVTQIFELRLALNDAGPEFVRRVASGAHAEHQVRKKRDPFVHGAPKLGRNDPCSCGSGKKYKKCHGRNA